ncbi:zinc-dependent metalloprotease [Dactylosporangium vinaceum]|nr:zinc-dependent metalloprotease [Dactylosporangium vinaceum]
MAQFVDWDLAAATAAALGKSGPAVSYEEAADAVSDLRELADEATGHVSEFTGLQAKVLAPPVRVVDRRDWAATNIAGLREVIQPLAERLAGGKPPGAIVGAIGSRFTGVQAGTVLAYLSGKVLGQYEVFSADPGQLLLVAPNIVEAERKLGADSRDFRLWVCLHEVTHRVQFTAVPWMRGHFLGEVGAFVDASQLNQDQLAERLRRGVTAMADVVRNPDSRVSVLDLVQTPGQKAVLDRLTALMTVLEGHAEFVMDGVGPEVIPSVEEIRGKFNRRREAGNPMDRVLRKLLGVDVKMRQYAEGRKFVHAVVERVGMDSFNRIWQSPLTIPRLNELSDPDAWIVRVLGASALSRSAAVVPPPASIAAPHIAEPPAPIATVPEPVDESPAEAGVAEASDVAGLPVAEPTPDAVAPAPFVLPEPAAPTAEPTASAVVPEPVDSAPGEAGVAEATAVAGLTAEEVAATESAAGAPADVSTEPADAPEPIGAFEPGEAMGVAEGSAGAQGVEVDRLVGGGSDTELDGDSAPAFSPSSVDSDVAAAAAATTGATDSSNLDVSPAEDVPDGGRGNASGAGDQGPARPVGSG